MKGEATQQLPIMGMVKKIIAGFMVSVALTSTMSTVSDADTIESYAETAEDTTFEE